MLYSQEEAVDENTMAWEPAYSCVCNHTMYYTIVAAISSAQQQHAPLVRLQRMALKKAALLQLPVVVDARAISHTTPAPVTAAVLTVVESILRARALRPSHRTASETRFRCTKVVL
jgi:hypothetical protein